MGLKKIEDCTIPVGANEAKAAGFVTEDEKYVVAASGRWNTNLNFAPTRDGKKEWRTLIRLDMSVAEFDKKDSKQGELILPYISGRVSDIKQAGAVTTLVTPGFDNEGSRFKNFTSNTRIFEAAKAAVKNAIDQLVSDTKEGKASALRANSEYISDAGDLASMAEKMRAEQPQQTIQVPRGSNLADAQVSGNSDLADAVGAATEDPSKSDD